MLTNELKFIKLKLKKRLNLYIGQIYTIFVFFKPELSFESIFTLEYEFLIFSFKFYLSLQCNSIFNHLKKFKRTR